MDRFLFMKENKDGTITISMRMEHEGEVHEFLLTMDFDQLLGAIVNNETLDEASQAAKENMILIPNDVDG